jgi:hypothetical protein
VPLKSRPPLGLPSGSVRALLTLMIVPVVIAQVVRGETVEPLWVETLMIALAHYFTSRRFLYLPPDVARRLESEGHLEEEAYPLYLPRYSIRVLIVLAFVGLAGFLYREGRLMEPRALSLLGVVFAYLLGTLLRGLLGLWPRWQRSRLSQRWDNLKAAVVLLVLAVTAAAYLLDRSDLLPPQARNVPLGLVLFYFGSR